MRGLITTVAVVLIVSLASAQTNDPQDAADAQRRVRAPVQALPMMRAPEAFGKFDASLVVRVIYDPLVMPISEEALNAMILSTAIGEFALQEALGAAYPGKRTGVDFGYEGLGRDRGGRRAGDPIAEMGRVWITGLDGDVPTATHSLENIVAGLADALENASGEDHRLITEQLARTRNEIEGAEQRLEELALREPDLQQRAGRVNLFGADVRNQIEKWRSRLNELQLEVEHAAVQKQLLAQQIAEIAERVQQRLAADEITEELRKVVGFREEALKTAQAMFENGDFGQSDLIDAMEQLARARTEVLSRQDQIRHETGQGELAALNDRLRQITVAETTSEAEVVRLEQALAAAEQNHVLELANEFENQVRMQQDVFNDRLKGLRRAMVDLEDRLRSFRPARLTVIRGTSADSAPGQ